MTPSDSRNPSWPWVTAGILAVLGLLVSWIFLVPAIGIAAVCAYLRTNKVNARQAFLSAFHPSVQPAVAYVTAEGVWLALCIQLGLTQRWGERSFPPRILALRPCARGVEIVVQPLMGQSVSHFEQASAALELALAVPRVTVSSPMPGQIAITLMTLDPLASPCSLSAPVQPVADLRRLPAGIDERGQWVWLDLANNSGFVVGGVPGSGKTVALSSWLTSLALSPLVQFALVDGKGGGDWAHWRQRAWLYSDSDDLSEVLELLRTVHNLMLARLRSATTVLGRSNTWDGGFTPGWPLVVLVVDECQTVLDGAGLGKDDKAVVAEITRIVSSLIRRGRSAGVICVLATQKADASSIPTVIRDNAALRACFAVKTNEAAVAVLGPSAWGVEGSPLEIFLPSGCGICVVPNESGGFTKLRVPYLSPSVSSAWLSATSGFRGDPFAGLSTALARDVDDSDVNVNEGQ
ncbi:phage integrase [Mycobacteroides abscessus subsp. massiliense]|uniref:FtsK/SpoIIIE domain-containing protein n=1 Tax=Mycobacteroides abscessus TaxID=36809 RepID=UPI0009A72D06|nr:FtsK/SpoIIIE domain-containing protein [Mycobacteroides abscessus]SKF92965.1 phage integrase [Mycobacteroides abscessus subsp. massiliense]SKH13982.1 phage integrase [Mycobacteroides abscessus subsp. massiliense]SKJ39499.1 phage integrase [Mycobacteroides abscessus subsp. massiliense]SKJ75769.1 phage integrase [Mycobacteroides abscessus subsp. massiliense]SKL03178.1 phage integrase [Mycobacteroides abscessus subsp. massiliense]